MKGRQLCDLRIFHSNAVSELVSDVQLILTKDRIVIDTLDYGFLFIGSRAINDKTKREYNRFFNLKDGNPPEEQHIGSGYISKVPRKKELVGKIIYKDMSYSLIEITNIRKEE